GGDDFAALGDTSSAPSTLQAAQSSSFGLLKLTLKANGYAYKWLTAARQPTFADQGSGACH
ncbi:MAG TPA: hypothetical protein VK576_04915, partial [Thermoleophilia bacterium]|nr:hypothetical protein [Thermoleophilia bacterium]